MRLSSAVFEDERAVGEQEARALAIHDAIEGDVSDHVDRQWERIKYLGAGALVVAVIGIGLLVAGSTLPGVGLLLLGLLGGGGGVAYVRSREPDVTVTSVEKGYWTGYAVPDRDGTVVFDATESIQPREFTLELLEDPEHAADIERELESMREFPVVMESEGNVEGSFVDLLDDVGAQLRDAESHEIRAPVLADGDPAMESLSRLAPMASEEPVDAGGVSLSMADANEQVETFSEFESMADEDHGESVLLSVSEQSRELATELSGLQETAVDLLNGHLDTAGDMFGRVSYNFYCPDCKGDDIDSQLELLDADGEWYCDTCRSNFAPDEGIPRHRIRDEIVLDVWDQLWIEKDDQRREIYESIEDQKAELEEREFEQRREEIRTAEERIKDIRTRIRDLQTEAKAKQGTVEEIGKLMVKYERLNERKKESFREDVAEAFDEIDEQTEAVLEETEGIIQDRIAEAEEEAEERAETMREEERQRERERVAHEQARADARAAGVMATIAATNENKPDRRGD
jgi:rubredoxin